MRQLPANPTLSELQTFVKDKCVERGWTDRTDVERVMMLTEEIGEIAKEIRKHTGKFGYDSPTTTDALAKEIVDVLNWLIDLANSNDINLEQALRAKWTETDGRSWPQDGIASPKN